MIGKEVSKGIHTDFDTFYKHTSKFIRSEYKVDDINIRSLDLEITKKLYNEYLTDRGINHNSALKNTHKYSSQNQFSYLIFSLHPQWLIKVV